MSSGKKVLLGGISAILLVAVVIGVVATVTRTSNTIAAPEDKPSSVSKSVETLCQSTDYKEACVRSLSNVVNGTSDPKAIVQAALNATVDGVRSAVEKAKHIGKDNDDKMQQAALSDCQELLQYAIDELEEAMELSSDRNIKDVSSLADDLKNWLSAVISYQETCVDGLTHPEIKSSMQDNLLNATQLTSNALAIVTELQSFAKSLGQFLGHHNVPTTGRRLLSARGFPQWLSAGDRKLLQAGKVMPNAVVAQDGSGDFKTISQALSAMPKNNKDRYVIYVKSGIYKENVLVDQYMVNVFMYGDGPRKSIVTGSKNFVDGTPTFQTATFAAVGTGFIAKSMGFQNTAGAIKHQAVALRVQSDMAVFFNCRMDAYQDTLYAQTHRQFYRNCVISGTIDFIFGDSATVIQNRLLIVRRGLDSQQNIVTAHGRLEKRESTGLVIHNCRIVPDNLLYPDRFKIATYLGRPWKEYSRTVIMESEIGDFIRPEGWMPWAGDFALKTLYYAEYGNRGAGAGTAKRVDWPGYRVITDRNEAMQFTVGNFIQGNLWLRFSGVPYLMSLKSKV